MPEPTAPTRGDVLVAAITGTVSVAALLALPMLGALDSAEPVAAPASGTWPWWLMLVALGGQAVALAWIRRRPVEMLLTVAGLPVLVAAVASAETTGLFTLASVVAVYRATLVRPRARDLRKRAAERRERLAAGVTDAAGIRRCVRMAFASVAWRPVAPAGKAACGQ